jgi:hypothetical protein
MKCGLCQQDVPKLAKSHVIPKSILMLGRPKGTSEPMVLIPSNATKRVLRSQAGIYSSIVCPACEASFQAGDDAMLALCRTWGQGQPYGRANEPVLCKIYPEISSTTLHRGLLTTLFRAHLSPHPMFENVDLGAEHGASVRKLLLSHQPTETSSYRAVIRTAPGLAAGTIMSPMRERWDGVNVYRFYFPHVSAFIKVDKKPFDRAWQDGALGALSCAHAMVEERLHDGEIARIKRAMMGRDAEVERFGGPDVNPTTA